MRRVSACRNVAQLTHLWFTDGMDIREWVATATNDASGREIALRIKEPVSTVNRQLAKDRPDPELIVAIAREYGASVLDALLAHGLIEQNDLAARVVVATLADADEKDLVAEIYRRVVKNEARKDDEHETPAPVVDIYGGRSPEEISRAADKSGIIEEPEYP